MRGVFVLGVVAGLACVPGFAHASVGLSLRGGGLASAMGNIGCVSTLAPESAMIANGGAGFGVGLPKFRIGTGLQLYSWTSGCSEDTNNDGVDELTITRYSGSQLFIDLALEPLELKGRSLTAGFFAGGGLSLAGNINGGNVEGGISLSWTGGWSDETVVIDDKPYPKSFYQVNGRLGYLLWTGGPEGAENLDLGGPFVRIELTFWMQGP